LILIKKKNFQALAMVDEECRRYKPSKNYLEHLPSVNMTIFETEMMKNEFHRLESGARLETMNTKRYELPAPTNLSEIQAWQESVDNSFAQLEHQTIRYLNLELLQKYGCESWKAALEILVGMSAKAQKQLAELKKEIQDVNWRRKNKQIQTGEKLNQLNNQWVSLVSCNFEIEDAIKKLEVQIHNITMNRAQHQPQQEQQQQANDDDGKPTKDMDQSNGHYTRNDVEEKVEDAEMKLI
jgi:pre-mRNA-splicing factor SPF27